MYQNHCISILQNDEKLYHCLTMYCIIAKYSHHCKHFLRDRCRQHHLNPKEKQSNCMDTWYRWRRFDSWLHGGSLSSTDEDGCKRWILKHLLDISDSIQFNPAGKSKTKQRKGKDRWMNLNRRSPTQAHQSPKPPTRPLQAGGMCISIPNKN